MPYKLLVIDDEPHIRMLYQEELELQGYKVATSDGQEPVLDVVDREKPDLIVLDIKLGDISGLDLLQAIRAKEPDLPVVLSSAYESFQHDLKSVVADAYCVKSVDTSQLLETISSVLDKNGKK